MAKLTDKEIQTAYQTTFQFDEVYENILMEQSFYESEIERLQAMKYSFDDKISKLKLTTKASDSDNIKQIKTITRKCMELQESVDLVNMHLNKTRLMRTEVEAHFRSSVSIINQHMANEDEEEDMLLGCLAYVLMME